MWKYGKRQYDNITMMNLTTDERFDKAILFSPLLKSDLSVSLSIKTCGSEVLLFSEFINIASTFYNCIDLIMLLSSFLVIFFD